MRVGKPNYEPGMSILYNPRTRIVAVTFRGQVTPIGEYDSEWEAVRAGESYCRLHGWGQRPAPEGRRSLSNPRRPSS